MEQAAKATMTSVYTGNMDDLYKTATGTEESDTADAQREQQLNDLLGQVNKLNETVSLLQDEMAPLREEGKEEIVYDTPFQESVYALIYINSYRCHAFWYSLFVILVQLLTITLTLLGNLDVEAGLNSNILMIPPMCDMIVTVAQAVAVFLCLPFQQDLIAAVLKLQNGHYPELQARYKHATQTKWLISCVLQLLAGLLLLVTIFVLTMQTTDVLSIMLNFAALHFMSEIDDYGFHIAKWGFVTAKLKGKAEDVCDFKLPQTKFKGYTFRRVIYFLAMIILFILYGILKQRQLSGHWLPTYVYVQFGEGYDPTKAYFSGIFYTQTGYTRGHREYYDLAARPSRTVKLSFCSAESVWTFVDLAHDSKDYDSCGCFAESQPTGCFAKSQPTGNYDVASIPDWEWEVLDPASYRFVPFADFTIISRDCDPTTCEGDCVGGLCQCDPGSFGYDCEFKAPLCTMLAVDGQTPAFPSDPYNQPVLSKGYQLMRDPDTQDLLSVDNMPVFYTYQEYPANFILFSGRRWILSGERPIVLEDVGVDAAYSGENYPNVTANVLKNLNNTNMSRLTCDTESRPYFFSEEVNFHSPDFKASPAGLNWFSIIQNDKCRTLPGNPISTILECQSCLSSEGGSCNPYGSSSCDAETGTCICREGYYGIRCDSQVNCYDQKWPCNGEGACDRVSGICRCNLPFYGNLCELSYWCIANQGSCVNSGKCTNKETCDCPDPATKGNSCEKVQHCSVWGCSNGGICQASTGFCSCEVPYYGELCDLVDDSLRPGSNETPPATLALFCEENNGCADGTCNIETGLCECQDPNLYGSLCQYTYNCTALGCMNDGACNDVSGRCDCSEPFFGRDCSELPDCTSDDDCLNSGTCDRSTGECVCRSYNKPYGNLTSSNATWDGSATGFAAGKLCETPTDCRLDEVDCFFGGSCNANGFCDCKTPYTGALCGHILDYGDRNPTNPPTRAPTTQAPTIMIPPSNSTNSTNSTYASYTIQPTWAAAGAPSWAPTKD